MAYGRRNVLGLAVVCAAGVLAGCSSSKQAYRDDSQRAGFGAGDSLGVAAFRVKLSPYQSTGGKTMVTGAADESRTLTVQKVAGVKDQ